MKNKLIIGLLILLCLFGVMRGSAYACYEHFEDFYTVNSYGDKTEINAFNYNDQPYLYMRWHLYCGIDGIGSLTWTSPNNNQYTYDISSYFDGWNYQTDEWSSLSTWNDVKEVGIWHIQGSINTMFGSVHDNYNTSFTVSPVVPEPVSSILFIAGGTLLVGRRYMKKRQHNQSLEIERVPRYTFLALISLWYANQFKASS